MTNGFQIRPLNDLLELNESGTWGTEGSTIDYPVLRSSNISDGRLVLEDIAYRRLSDRDAERYKLDDGDIIVTKSSGSPHLIGKSCYFGNPDGRTYLFSDFTQRLRVKRDLLHPLFLSYFLESRAAKHYLKKISNTTSGLRNLSMKDYAKQPIPVPPLPIQKQIAAILEKADAAREKRRQANQLTEQFLQSAFLEIFGDPVTNPKGWESQKLAECIVSKPNNGFFAKGHHYNDQGIPIIWISDFIDRFYSRVTGLKRVQLKEKDVPKYEVKYGDVLFCRSSLNYAGVGKAGIIARELAEATIFVFSIFIPCLNASAIRPSCSNFSCCRNFSAAI